MHVLNIQSPVIYNPMCEIRCKIDWCTLQMRRVIVGHSLFWTFLSLHTSNSCIKAVLNILDFVCFQFELRDPWNSFKLYLDTVFRIMLLALYPSRVDIVSCRRDEWLRWSMTQRLLCKISPVDRWRRPDGGRIKVNLSSVQRKRWSQAMSELGRRTPLAC